MTDSGQDRQDRIAEEARGWIARMASGDMDAGELARFKAWRSADPLHNRAFEDARGLWRAAAAGVELPLPVTQRHRSWRRNLSMRRAIVSLRRPAAAAAVAAAILAGVVVGPELSIMLRADHRSGAVVESVTLPDGSRAMLDAGAAISVAYDGDERRIELLRGDAWFDVAHGDPRPFRVAARGGITQDIGTAFEVRREEDAVSVAVSSGAVEVHGTANRAGVLLRAAQAARYAGDGSVERLTDIAPDRIAAWRQGEILFDRVSVEAAIGRIGRYRAAPVFLSGLPDDMPRISGVFRTDRPDEAIDAVARMAGLTVYRIGGIAVLRPAA